MAWLTKEQRAADKAQKRADREEYAAEFDLTEHSEETLELIFDGSIEICPVCRKLSAYAWQDSDIDDGGAVAHIPAACGLGSWQCGHCHRTLAPVESMLNAPAYSHCDD